LKLDQGFSYALQTPATHKYSCFLFEPKKDLRMRQMSLKSEKHDGTA
jgi:hypothetical protein